MLTWFCLFVIPSTGGAEAGQSQEAGVLSTYSMWVVGIHHILTPKMLVIRKLKQKWRQDWTLGIHTGWEQPKGQINQLCVYFHPYSKN